MDDLTVTERFLTHDGGIRITCLYVGDVFQFHIRVLGEEQVHSMPGPLARKVLKSAYDEAERRWSED